MRLQLALNVDDLETAIDYYGRMLGVEVHKREPGYANFVVEQPALKLVLFEAPGTERLNHVGFEVFEDESVNATADRLEAAGVLTERQQDEVCCFAKQNKAVSHDPQGLMWEWYRLIEDSPTFFADPEPAANAGSTETAEQKEAVSAGRCC